MKGASVVPMLREGKRWDFLYMGILREEWLAKQAAADDSGSYEYC